MPATIVAAGLRVRHATSDATSAAASFARREREVAATAAQCHRRHHDRRQHRRRDEAQRPAHERWHLAAREERDERQPRQVREPADGDDDDPQRQRARHRARRRSLREPGRDADQPGADHRQPHRQGVERDHRDARTRARRSASVRPPAPAPAGRESTAARRSRATTRREARCRANSRRGWTPATCVHSSTPVPRKYDAPLRVSPESRKRRIAAANAWSVSRNASALRHAAGQRLQVRRHRRAVHHEAQADDEAGEHDHRHRRLRREELRGDDLRRAGEDDRRKAERAPDRRAQRLRRDAAHQSERQEADQRRRHVADAGNKIGTGEERAHVGTSGGVARDGVARTRRDAGDAVCARSARLYRRRHPLSIPGRLSCRDHDAGFSCTMGAYRDSAMTSATDRFNEPVLAACTTRKASLGECPIWSVSEQALYWVDINAPALNRFDPAGGANVAMPMPESIGCFALARRRRLRRRAARRLLARAPRRHARPARSPTRPTTRRTTASTTAAATAKAGSGRGT